MERKMTDEEAENFRLAQQAFASGDIEYVAKRLVELSKAKAYERAQAVRRLRRSTSDDGYTEVRRRLADDDGSRIPLEDIEREYGIDSEGS